MKKLGIILLLLLSLSTVFTTVLAAQVSDDIKFEYVADKNNCETKDSNNGENVKPDLHTHSDFKIYFTTQVAKPTAFSTTWGEAYPVPLFEPPRN